MLRATNPATRRYWNGSEYIVIPCGAKYKPKSEAEREALLKCQGIVEELETAPPPPPRRNRKR